jgi:cytochrome c556
MNPVGSAPGAWERNEMRAAGIWSLLIVAALTLAAQAASLKSIMREMRATLRDAAAIERAFDAVASRNLFEALAREGEASAKDSPRSAQARFAAFIGDARKAAADVATAAQFKTALAGLAAQCRSCHDATR